MTLDDLRRLIGNGRSPRAVVRRLGLRTMQLTLDSAILEKLPKHAASAARHVGYIATEEH